MNIHVLHGQLVTEPTAATTTFVDAASIAAASFLPGRKYVLIATILLKAGLSSDRVGCRMVHGSTPTVFDDSTVDMDVVGNDCRIGGSYLFMFTQPSTTEDVTLQFNSPNNTGTITHQFSSIIACDVTALREGVDYAWQEILTDTADATTLTSRAGVTVSCNGSDTWAILGQAAWDCGATGVNFSLRLLDSVGPTGYGDDGNGGYPAQVTTDLYNFMYYTGIVPTNASHTFNVQTKSNTSQTVLSSRIFVLNLNVFAQRAVTYTADSDNPTQNNVWETEASLSPTPDTTGDWVILAIALAGAVGADNLIMRLQINPDGGGLASDPAYGDDSPDRIAPSGRFVPFPIMTVKQLTSGASRAINFDWTQSATGTASVKERGLIAFSVALAGGNKLVNISQAVNRAAVW